MSVRRIALLITAITLVALAAPVTAAAADAPSIPQLRSQLRYTRHHLSQARVTLLSARAKLADVRALVAALDAAGVEGVAPVTTDPSSTATATGSTASDTPEPTPAPTPTPTPTEMDPAVSAAVAEIDAALAARILADGVVDDAELDGLQARVAKWRRIVRRMQSAENTLEARLARRLQIRDWNRRGVWRPLIEIAARRYHVNPDGLYRLMMYESGGRRYAGGAYKGLFQYYPGTWRAGWNPYRSASIYDGWAQIRATAYAISRGMGPGNWSSTYYRAF